MDSLEIILALILIIIAAIYFIFANNSENQIYNTDDLKIIRDMLNKIEISSMNKSQLLDYCNEIENKISDSADLLPTVANFTSDKQFCKAVSILKQILNKAPLDKASTITMDTLLSYTPNFSKPRRTNHKAAKSHKFVNFNTSNSHKKSVKKDTDINPALEQEMGYMYEYGWDEREPIRNKSLRNEKISNYEYYEAPYECEDD